MAEDRDTLPPLPIRHTWDIDYDSRKPYDLYTADQLRAYAAQAVAQQAESRRAAQAQVAQLQERIARAGIEQQRAVREAVAQERERCARIVEAYKVPVGNSAAGEMACEWTMDALKEVRDAIRAGSPSPQPAPAGRRLVPEEATWDMRIAGSTAYREPRDGHYTARMECADDAYRAMLAAAPQPPSATATTGYAQVIDGPKGPGLEWDDSACPTCGEDGGTSCGMPNCGLLQGDEEAKPVAYRYWKDKFACWEYSDTPLEFPAVPAGTVMEPLYLHQPPPPSVSSRAEELLRDAVRHAEWHDKHIHPWNGESFQTWCLTIYLPVPLSMADKSPEAALNRVLNQPPSAGEETKP
jgi:hypothetical protein